MASLCRIISLAPMAILLQQALAILKCGTHPMKQAIGRTIFLVPALEELVCIQPKRLNVPLPQSQDLSEQIQQII